MCVIVKIKNVKDFYILSFYINCHTHENEITIKCFASFRIRIRKINVLHQMAISIIKKKHTHNSGNRNLKRNSIISAHKYGDRRFILLHKKCLVQNSWK